MTAIHISNQQHSSSDGTGIALDVGEKRIGVARADLGVRFAGPLTTLEKPDCFVSDIAALCRSQEATWIVIGLPRGMDGQETAQTAYAQAFGRELEAYLAEHGPQLPVYWIDEALTSHKAEQELQSRGKPYIKADIDALAAIYILEDFMNQPTKSTLEERNHA